MFRCWWAFLILLVAAVPELRAERVCDLPPPGGYTRIDYPQGSYSRWLQNLPLKADKTIATYDGQSAISLHYKVLAVVDKPLLFKTDLEQCADFCMRFWAEYHQSIARLDHLFLFDYHGKPRAFRDSGRSFREFLRWHMAYANSHAIKKGAPAVTTEKLDPGDMFVQNRDGGIGHVSLVVDAAENAAGQRVYLIGYGFIPAQQFHIEAADTDNGPQGWFTRQGYERYLRGIVFNRYGTPVVRRFGD